MQGYYKVYSVYKEREDERDNFYHRLGMTSVFTASSLQWFSFN